MNLQSIENYKRWINSINYSFFLFLLDNGPFGFTPVIPSRPVTFVHVAMRPKVMRAPKRKAPGISRVWLYIAKLRPTTPINPPIRANVPLKNFTHTCCYWLNLPEVYPIIFIRS